MNFTAPEAQRMLLQRRMALGRPRGAGMGGVAASGTLSFATTEEIPERARAELEEIDAALVRIAEGTFGTCIRCGGAIGHQRLRAMPETPYCMACRG